MRACAVLGAMALLITSSAMAQAPGLVNYQGRLLDTSGDPVNDAVNVEVDIYSLPTGGEASFTESIGVVPVEDGIYSFKFGGNAGVTSTVTTLETMATGNGIIKWFPYTASNSPIVNPSVTISDGTHTWDDLSGSAEPRFECVVDHATGWMSVEYRQDLPAPAAGVDVTVTYGYTDIVPTHLMPALMGPEAWLEVTINGEPLSPRERLVSVPYSLRSAEVDRITNGTVIENGIIGPDALEERAIGNDQLQKSYASGSIPLQSLLNAPTSFTVSTNIVVTFEQPFQDVPIITFSVQDPEGLRVQYWQAQINSVSGDGFELGISASLFVRKEPIHNLGDHVHGIFALVNSSPACALEISAEEPINDTLYYGRSLDLLGVTWAHPVLCLPQYYGTAFDLAEVNGHPAILFSDEGDLKYIQAADPYGMNWGDEHLVYSGATYTRASLTVINGRPAVAFQGGELRYCRALDADGSSWGPSTVVADITDSIVGIGLAQVNGRPAIGYSATGHVYYTRSQDTDGFAWGGSITVATGVPHGSPYQLEPAFTLVGDIPAFAYAADESGVNRIYYRRATDADGDSWAAPVVVHDVDAEESNGRISLLEKQGLPFILYGCWGVQANDPSGALWGEPEYVESSLQRGVGGQVEGQPAFIDGSGYLRLSSAADAQINWMAVEP